MKKNFGKVLLLSSVLVLLAAGCSKQQATSPQPKLEQRAAIEQKFDDAVLPPTTPTPASPIAAPKVTDYIKYSGVEGKDALELLKAKYPNQVETKNYSGMGEFVESIGEVKADSKHFWEFFVNGKSSNVGASSYVTKNGDVLEWKLSAIK